MKTISIATILKTVFFIILLSFPLFCIGLFAQSSIEKTFDEMLASEFTPDGPGATVLVAKGDEIIYRKAFGMANVELGVTMQPEHIFRLGSITKQFTAVAILKLQEEGKLSVKDPITRFLPDYPTQGHEILIEHLLTHTSGIKSMTNMPAFFPIVRKDMSTQEMLDFFKEEPMEFAPGEGYNYNNSGYFLLGVIIEKITGKSYAKYIEEIIFQPLNMEHSYYDSHEEVISGRTSGYDKRGEKLVNTQYISHTLPYSAGSLISNIDDLLTWNKALHAYKVINEESLKQAFAPFRLKDGEQISYAYGWDTGKLQGSPMVEHGGSIFGYNTQGVYLQEEDIYVIVMSNCGCMNPTNLAFKLAGISIGKPFDFKAIDLDVEQLAAYTGLYEVEEDEQREVTLKDGQLYANRKGRTPRKIYPFAVDQFFYEGTGLTTLRFEKDTAGKVIKMTARFVNGEERSAKRIGAIEKKEEVKLDEAILKEYTGTYEIGPIVVTFTVEEGWLMGKPQDDSKERLYPLGDDKFDVRGVGAQIKFSRDENNEITGLTFNQGGREMIGEKRN